MITPRALGGFPAINENGTNCILYWGPATSDKSNIDLYSPDQCKAGKVFCSGVSDATDDRCSKYQGAAIVCGDATKKSVDGILLNNGGCDAVIPTVPPSFRLNYHSIGDYSDWINKVSGAEDMKQSSLILMTAAIFVAIKNLVY